MKEMKQKRPIHIFYPKWTKWATTLSNLTNPNFYEMDNQSLTIASQTNSRSRKAISIRSSNDKDQPLLSIHRLPNFEQFLKKYCRIQRANKMIFMHITEDKAMFGVLQCL